MSWKGCRRASDAVHAIQSGGSRAVPVRPATHVSPQFCRRIRVGLDQVTNTDATGPITQKSPASTSLFLVGLFASRCRLLAAVRGPGVIT